MFRLPFLRVFSRPVSLAVALSLPFAAVAQGTPPPDAATLERQMAELTVDVPGSIWALQPFRNTTTLSDAQGREVTLTSMNPHVNSWFVLQIREPGVRARAFHLENADPEAWSISLVEEDGPQLLIEGEGQSSLCTPWRGDLNAAQSTSLPFAPICDWSLFVRNAVQGNRTTREAVSDFLRENVIFGDNIVNLIKGAFFEDAFMVSSEGFEAEEPLSGVEVLGTATLARTPQIRPAMGFDLIGTDNGAMTSGAWYEIEDAPGIYASAMQPGMIADSVFQTGGANGLDGIERNADVYLVAFDMDEFDIGYELGTDHPDLSWSPRPSGGGRHFNGPGPDGFDRPDPLVLNGMLSPALTDRVAATFTGGFKRQHGAWRFGDYSQFNWGHHYGFMSNGVLLSRLWPNLATLYMTTDGEVGMRTWGEGEEDRLQDLVFARQNGVPLIENGVPGDRVTSWGGGNWSGSAEADLRTLRGGACTRNVDGRQFLIYAYFSTATPSGMARTFQAYQCDYAMLLDMNSQELTYMALYLQGDDGLETRHLVTGMADTDPRDSGGRVPRFVEAPDNRDFFYLTRRE